MIVSLYKIKKKKNRISNHKQRRFTRPKNFNNKNKEITKFALSQNPNFKYNSLAKIHLHLNSIYIYIHAHPILSAFLVSFLPRRRTTSVKMDWLVPNNPLSFLSKIDIHEIEIHGANVKVSVVDNPAVAVAKINGLKSYLQNVQRHVVGLDYTVIPGETLLLCVETHCLIIQLESLDCVPNTLK